MTSFSRLLATTTLALSIGTVQAGSIYFFGDSLTDSGNTSAAFSGALPGPGYATGQWTDPLGSGVWANQFAATLGQPNASRNSLVPGGQNYAWAGARTYSADSTPTTSAPPSMTYAAIDAAYTAANPGKSLDLTPFVAGLDQQISSYLGASPAKSSNSDLFVIMIGGNDVAAGLTAAQAVGNPGEVANAIGYGLNQLQSGITRLIGDGASHFLIANMPDVAATPRVQGQGAAVIGGVNAFVGGWNAAFNNLILGLQATPGLDIDVLDLYGLSAQAPALFAARGIPNPVNGACLPANPADCRSYYYSDPFHPSSTVHSMIADAALRAVPLPGTIALFCLGLMGLIGMRRKAA